MSNLTAEGAPVVDRTKGRQWIRRTVTVDRELDAKVMARRRAQPGLTYSDVMEDALRVLFDVRKKVG